MAEESDTKMEGGFPTQELAADASNIEVVPEQEERAAKRLKVDNPAVEAAVPGEGLHDAPAAQDTNGSTAPNGENGQTAQDSEDKAKSGHVDGRMRNVAPIKKE